MFSRVKPSGARSYLQLVENTRDGTTTRQRVLVTLGRVDDLETAGKLDALLQSGARFCETALLISNIQDGTLETSETARIGAPLIFGRLWQQTGCAAVIERFAAGRGFGFSLERAVFASVLHRLVVSGSDRAGNAWLDGYAIEGVRALDLHHLYRAMAWLGEELDDQSGATRAPRRTKDLIEEALFQRRRNLFSNLSVVLFDTTSLMFAGNGGESLGQRGVSSTRSAPGGGWRRARRRGTADLLRDLARQRHRRQIAAAGGGAATLPLRHRADVRGRRPRHDQCRDPW